MIIHTPLAVTLVAVATAAAMIFISLGHLPRPTRATTLWIATFVDLMLASYIWIGADLIDSPQLRGVGNGLVFASMALMWSGMRAFRGVPSKLWVSLLMLVGLPLLLLATSFTNFYFISFRAMFVATGVFAALTIVEALRLGRSVREETLPLIAVTSLYLVFEGIIIVDGVMVAAGMTNPVDSLLFIRGANLIGANVFTLCALVTLLLLATRDTTVRVNSPDDIFSVVVRDRLARAQASDDPWWSFVDIRLDDPHDIRMASSNIVFNEIIDSFRREINDALPADADIRAMSPAQIVALVPRAQGGMNEIIVDLLKRVSAIETPESFPIRLSASVGWSHAVTGDYDLDTLLTTTGDAVLTARDAGGDRWERVHGDR